MTGLSTPTYPSSPESKTCPTKSKLEDSILKQLFLQSLPNNVRIILTSLTETVDLEQLAELVDRIS